MVSCQRSKTITNDTTAISLARAFAFGSLVKVIARQGLNIVDGDVVRCFIQLRWQKWTGVLGIEGARANFPTYSRYMEAEGGPSAFCERLAVTSKVPCDEIKKLVISATNGGGNIHRGVLGDFLDGMLKESLNMAEMDAAMNQATAKHFENHEKPLISFLAATDWDMEHKAVKKFDSVHFANEWDGVVAFTVRSRVTTRSTSSRR